MAALISDEMLDVYAVTGTWSDLPRRLARKQQLNRGWTRMNTDTGSSDKGKRRNAWATPVHSPVLLGLDPFRKQCASFLACLRRSTER